MSNHDDLRELYRQRSELLRARRLNEEYDAQNLKWLEEQIDQLEMQDFAAERERREEVNRRLDELTKLTEEIQAELDRRKQ